MANAAVDIGTGASAVFSGTSLSLNFTSMDLGEQSIEVIDTTHLGTSGFKTIMGGDLKDPGEWTFEFQWDNEAGPDPSATAETGHGYFSTVGKQWNQRGDVRGNWDHSVDQVSDTWR
jgi:hypothetical protein